MNPSRWRTNVLSMLLTIGLTMLARPTAAENLIGDDWFRLTDSQRLAY